MPQMDLSCESPRITTQAARPAKKNLDNIFHRTSTITTCKAAIQDPRDKINT